MLLTLTLSVNAVSALSQQGDSEPVYEGKAAAAEATIDYGHYVMQVPQVSERELDEYARALELTGPQLDVFGDLYREYQARYAALHESTWKSINDQAVRVGDIYQRREYLPEDFRIIERHYRQQREANELIVAFEDQFFDAANEMLTEEQRTRLVGVRAIRAVSRYEPGSVRISGAQLDLVEVISGLGINVNGCHAFFEAYAQDLGQLRHKHYVEDLRRRVGLAKFRSQRSLNDPGALQDRAKLLRELIRIEMRIRAVNVIFLEQLRTCLEPNQAGVVIEVARTIMYPSLFPDKRAEAAFGEVAAVRDEYELGSIEYAAFQELIDNYVIQYEAVVSVLVETIVTDEELFHSTLFAFAGEREAQKQTVQKLLAKRDAVCQSLIDSFAELQADIADARSSKAETTDR